MSEIVSAEASDELADRIDGYRRPDESRSAAIRRLLEAGLEAEDRSPLAVTPALALFWFGTLMFAASPAMSITISLGPITAWQVGLVLIGAALLVGTERGQRAVERAREHAGAVRGRLDLGRGDPS
jgi:hypothetical protein